MNNRLLKETILNKLPEIQFTQWYKWSERSAITNLNMPGIYAIAITKQDIANKSFQWSDVVYIGMTNSQKGLLGRLYQFEKSITGRFGHSGGNRIYKDIGKYDSKLGKWNDGNSLFVAVQPIECNSKTPNEYDFINMGYVAYLEYLAFAEFFKRYNIKTKYNKK